MSYTRLLQPNVLAHRIYLIKEKEKMQEKEITKKA